MPFKISPRGTSVKKIFLFIVLTLLLAGCQNRPAAEPVPKPLANYFQGDWNNIDRIDIRNGATGELWTITEKDIIRKWIDETRIIELSPDPNQEARTGFRYSANGYQGDRLKFGFTDSRVADFYILLSESENLYKQLKSLYES